MLSMSAHIVEKGNAQQVFTYLREAMLSRSTHIVERSNAQQVLVI